jgi:hypothetical protein
MFNTMLNDYPMLNSEILQEQQKNSLAFDSLLAQIRMIPRRSVNNVAKNVAIIEYHFHNEVSKEIPGQKKRKMSSSIIYNLDWDGQKAILYTQEMTNAWEFPDMPIEDIINQYFKDPFNMEEIPELDILASESSHHFHLYELDEYEYEQFHEDNCQDCCHCSIYPVLRCGCIQPCMCVN